MGQGFINRTDETVYNCRCCGTPIAKAQQMICTKHYNQAWGVCFVFRDVMNVKRDQEFPVEFIHLNSYILLDDQPIGDISNDIGNHVFCSQCNDFLGWSIRTQNKYVLVRRKLA